MNSPGGDHDQLPDPLSGPSDLRLPSLTTHSQEVLETLARHKGRADHFYEGALRALADRSNPVRAEAAAYCLRELIEELERAALAPQPGPGLGLGRLFETFRTAWKGARRNPDDGGLLDNSDPAVFAADEFVDAAGSTQAARRDRAQTTLSGLDPVQRLDPPDTHEARVKRLLDYRDEFNHVLHGEMPTNPEDFKTSVEAFETFLLRWFAPRTFEDLGEIDHLLAQGPPRSHGPNRREKVELIRATAANLDYFFANLGDSSWLPFLLEEGFFENPTPPETGTTDEGQTWFRYPNWPESQFLARIAAESPERVVEAIERIPDAANPRAHEDIIVAATSLPGGLASRIALREQRWLAIYDGHLMSLPRRAGELLAHLARERQMESAFKLAGTLLKIVVDPYFENRSSRRRAVGFVGDWEYGEILKIAWPPMMEAEPEKAFRFLCHRLAEVVRLGYIDESGFDPTYIWRAAIEDHGQNTRHSLLDTLIETIRDTALAEAGKGAEKRDLVLAEFDRHDSPLFRRFTLFVLAEFGQPQPIAAALADRALFEDANVWHEYAELLRSRFGDLDANQRGPILELVAAGPNDRLKEFQRERGNSDEEVEAYSRHWRLRHYDLIAENLDGELKAVYELLLTEFGKPEHPTLLSVVTVSDGPASPYSAEELTAMNPTEVIETVRDWSAEGGHHTEVEEALARALEVAVEKRADGFATIATEFVGLDPIHIRALLSGLGKAAREESAFPWGPVLGICELVAVFPTSDSQEASGEAPTKWLHRTMVGLLSDGLKKREVSIPYGERERVWSLLEPYLEDGDPSSERDRDGDTVTVAINSVRGEALHAAINYAFWIERALATEDSFEGIASLPEFAEAIDRRLNPDVEPSTAIRAVLGEWFVQFVRIDERWARTLAPRIFPSGPESKNFFSAAWNAYVVFNQAWLPVFEILRESYDLAVERFEEVEDERHLAGNPREHLGEHLMFLRFSGAVDLDNGVFPRFWSIAPTEIRRHVIRNVGWSLSHGNSGLSDEVRSRIVDTWEWIVDHGSGAREALEAFGAWFGAQQLDSSWLLRQGVRLLEEGIPLEPDHAVYDALPRMAEGHPREVVETLRLMIETERWSVSGSTDEVRQALATVADSDDEVARTAAVGVIHLLGARGMNEFRDLLPPTAGD